MATILIIFAMIFVFGPIAKAYADRMTRDLPSGGGYQAEDLARLRGEVERLSTEVERLSDEQSFMVRLLDDGEKRRLSEGDPGPK